MPIFSCGAVIGSDVERDAAFGRPVEARHRAQQRGLAATGAADDRDDLARFDVERYAVDGAHAARIRLADPMEREHVSAPPRARTRPASAGTDADAATTSQSVSLPSTAKVRIAATICAGLPSCWPSISR